MSCFETSQEVTHFGLENRGDVGVVPPADALPANFRVGADGGVSAILAVVVAAGVSACGAVGLCDIVAVTMAVVGVVDVGGLTTVI